LVRRCARAESMADITRRKHKLIVDLISQKSNLTSLQTDDKAL
jgi:hypothetical protein